MRGDKLGKENIFLGEEREKEEIFGEGKYIFFEGVKKLEKEKEKYLEKGNVSIAGQTNNRTRKDITTQPMQWTIPGWDENFERKSFAW